MLLSVMELPTYCVRNLAFEGPKLKDSLSDYKEKKYDKDNERLSLNDIRDLMKTKELVYPLP